MFQLDDDFDIDVNFLDDVLKSDDSVSPEPINPVSSKKSKSSPVGKKPRLEPSRIIHFSPSKVKKRPAKKTRDTSLFNFNSSPDDELKNSLSSIFQEKKVPVRKFPGPAGLLPQRQANTSLVASNDFLTQLEQEACPDLEELPQVDGILSQGSVCAVDSETWARMESALGPQGKTLLNTINLAAVGERAKLYRGRALRVPFLATSLASIDTSTPDPSVKLQDGSGEMMGALHREAWEVLVDSLVTGSVLILTGVGVVPASFTNYYINITSKNIVAVFSPCSSTKESKLDSLGPCSSFIEAWHRTRIPPPSRSPSTPVLRPLQQHSPYGGNPGWRATSPQSSQGSSIPQNMDGYRGQNNFRRTESRFMPPNLSSISRPKIISNNYNQPIPLNSSSSPSQCSEFQNSQIRGQSFMGINQITSQKQSLPGPKVKTLDEDPLNQSIVESLLEGIDTDSLFGDF